MKKKNVFISYAHPDKDMAFKIASLYEKYGAQVWIDFGSIQPGEFISRKIEEGLQAANYFTIVISQRSISSRWVQAELAMAFDLGQRGGLVLIPAKIDDAQMPLELRGLLFIDFSADFEDGATRLAAFLRSEDKRAAAYYGEVRGAPSQLSECQQRLQALEISDLRFELSTRMTKDELGVVWFDTFLAKMDDEINAVSTGVVATELIWRAQARRKMDRLIRFLCRERPDLHHE